MKNNTPYRLSSATPLLLGLLLITGCFYGRLSVQTVVSIPPLPDSTIVAQLPTGDVRHIAGQKIGTVSYAQSDYDPFWTNDRIADYLRTTALQHGANLVKMTDLQPRTQYSRARPSFTADLYRVADARNYEDQAFMEWSADRKLSLADFKFYSRWHYDTSNVPSEGKYDFDIVARFYYGYSWINPASKDTTEALLHEQGNFDLCEIYCRHYLASIREYNTRMPTIKRIYAAWKAKRIQYESETAHGLDYRRQAEWTAKIHQALADRTDSSCLTPPALQ